MTEPTSGEAGVRAPGPEPTSLSFPSGHSAAGFPFRPVGGAACRSSRCRCTPPRVSSSTRACTPASTIPATSWSARSSVLSWRSSRRTPSIATVGDADHPTVPPRGQGGAWSAPGAAAGCGPSGGQARACRADLAVRAPAGRAAGSTAHRRGHHHRLTVDADRDLVGVCV